MANEPATETASLLTLSAERRIDGICVGFEKALQAEQPVRIEDFLGASTEHERSALLRDLLRTELEHRVNRGDRPTVGEYGSRFPEQVSLIAACLMPTSDWPVLADYEIMGVLGRGGMGVVYHARQKSLDRSVALKMILERGLADAGAVSKFRGEAQTIARLRHPNIVHVHEVGELNGSPFFTLEFVEGGSLATRLLGPPFSDNEAAQMVELLARTLHYAHGQGIVHRDLKPANILLAKDGTPKVADFGLAKMLSDESGTTRTGTVMGTASYMAPEAAAGKVKEVGPATDVYALGAILYELLTGQPPFRGDSFLDVLRRVEQETPEPPRVHNPRVDRPLEAICLKCLEKSPKDRYPSAEALAVDLCAYLRGEAVVADRSSARRLIGNVLRDSPYTEVMTRWSMIWMALSVTALTVSLLQASLLFAAVTDVRPYFALWIAKLVADTGASWFFRLRVRLSMLPVERQLGQIWVFFWVAHFLTYWCYHRAGGAIAGFVPIVSLECAVVIFAMAAILGGSFYVSAALCLIVAFCDAIWPGTGQLFGAFVIAPLWFWLGWKHLPRNRAG